MSFLDIKDPAERATLVKEYVTAMKTVKQRNMVNREMKLAIGDELQTLFHPIVNATKQAAEETRKELAPMKNGVMYLPGDINRLTKKLYLLVGEFFAGNTTVRNELVHVLDALFRLKQLTRKEYTDIVV